MEHGAAAIERRLRLFAHIQRQSVGFFGRRKTGARGLRSILEVRLLGVTHVVRYPKYKAPPLGETAQKA